ncbi:hypothetical protein BDF19DRAFT_429624 [Syncephalis fuscata]|nr:hypothetical protein BDF19DRAFT_429624 [Syncephalis fuscata]
MEELHVCPLCSKSITKTNFEQHYRKELALLATPKLSLLNTDTNSGSGGSSSMTGDGTTHLGKRGAAIAAKHRILGESTPQKETPDQLINKIKRRAEQRDKWLSTIGGSHSLNNDQLDEAAQFLLPQERRRRGGDREIIESTCFMCGISLSGDLTQINAHIDQCLDTPNGPSVLSTTTTTASNAASDHTDMTFEEYTWAGQTRVRVTSMLEGGASALASTSTRRVEEDTNEELDIDLDDTEKYGAQQYTEEDVRRVIHTEATLSTDPTPTSTDRLTDMEMTNAESTSVLTSSSSSVVGDDLARAHLLIASLKDRIRQQEQLISNAGKCLICIENYKQPTTSIVCWHVYCETCWLQSLGAKKVCPQCQTITQPADLRRIYF